MLNRISSVGNYANSVKQNNQNQKINFTGCFKHCQHDEYYPALTGESLAKMPEAKSTLLIDIINLIGDKLGQQTPSEFKGLYSVSFAKKRQENGEDLPIAEVRYQPEGECYSKELVDISLGEPYGVRYKEVDYENPFVREEIMKSAEEAIDEKIEEINQSSEMRSISNGLVGYYNSLIKY